MLVMRNFLILLFLSLSFSSFTYSQTPSAGVKSTGNSDHEQLKALVVKLLKWHEADKIGDFDPLLKAQTDSIYRGIDWDVHTKRVAELERTGFFTKSFLDNYQKIAEHLDKELKQNSTKYYVGELPPYGNGTNEWCNCQDFPSDIWMKLKIVELKTVENSATFKWTWGDGEFYSVKAIKENAVWKIEELERFHVKYFSW